MRMIRLLVEYDGSAYAGWQLQPNAPTVQGTLEAAVEKLTGTFSRVNGASRTDSGVHAFGQVAAFQTESSIPADIFSRALNAHLPKDIAIRRSDEVGVDFTPRHHARGKIYHYLIENTLTRPALDRHRVWWCPWTIAFDALQEAARYFVGEHDFAAFAAAGASEAARENTVRTIMRAEWRREDGRFCFVVEGTAFLYKMVRCMVGTLVEVGRGRMQPSDIPRILASKDHSLAGPTAPAQGLHLMKVHYPDYPWHDAPSVC